MASIQQRKNKDGAITSYVITVSAGYDHNGKKLKHTKSIKYDPSKTALQNEKAAKKEAAVFEQSVEAGYQLDNRQTFAEYAQYVLDLKRRGGGKVSTLVRYEELLIRINSAIGNMKLTDIRPQHLNHFYAELAKDGVRRDKGKATAKPTLLELQKEQGLSGAKIAKSADVSSATVSAMLRGQTVQMDKAEAVAAVFDKPVKTLFDISYNTAPLSNKTILEHHRLISTILAQAEKEMLVPYNAASKATPPKVEKKTPNYFQPEQIEAILDELETAPLKWRTITTLYIVTGCRRGEIAGLSWNNVNFSHNEIFIEKALVCAGKEGVYEESTKTGESRWLKVPEEAMDLLRQYKLHQEQQRQKLGSAWVNTGYVFTQEKGERIHPDSVTGWLDEYSKRHGLPHINPHAFRHTAASVLLSNDIDVVTVAGLLGHKQVSTTENTYAHIIERRKAEAAECIADVLLRKKDA